MTTVTNQTPTSGAVAIATGTSIYFELTDADTVDQSSLQVLVDGRVAIQTAVLVADGSVLTGSNVFRSNGIRIFTVADVGRIIFTDSATAGNTGTATIVSVLDAQRVTTDKTYSVAENGMTWKIQSFESGFTGTVVVDGTDLEVTIVPDDDLPGSTVVTTSIQVADLLGNLNDLDWSFTTSARPQLSSVSTSAVDAFGRGIRLTFNEVMNNNSAFLIASNYVLSAQGSTPTAPTIIGTSVSGPSSFVDLLFDNPTVYGGAYLLTVLDAGIESNVTGNDLDVAPGNQISFVGTGIRPSVSLVKDTTVQIPVVTGPQYVDFRQVQVGTLVRYELQNLDADVISLAVGPSSVGIRAISGFVNSGVGTGRVDVELSPLAISYRIAFLALDNVGNQSYESALVFTLAQSDTLPGSVFEIRPKAMTHQEVFDRVIADIPQGTTYLKDGFVVPHGHNEAIFTLKVIDPGNVVFITVAREGPTAEPESHTISVIPENIETDVRIRLGKGRNYITAVDGTNQDFIVVSSTTFATLLNAQAQEIYQYIRAPLEEYKNALYSPYSAKMAEPLLLNPELLPTIRPQQILSTKLAVRSLISQSGQEQAVRDTLVAYTLQTPFFEATRNNQEFFDPGLFTLYRNQEDFSGFDAHVWVHNLCIARWAAFVKFATNFPEQFKLVSIDEHEVVYRDSGNRLRTHSFDSSSQVCSSLEVINTCFDAVTVEVESEIGSTLEICAAEYPFDLMYTTTNPMGGGRVAFDTGVPWDTGFFDEDYLDPTNDGWDGFGFIGRWDGRFAHYEHVTGAGGVRVQVLGSGSDGNAYSVRYFNAGSSLALLVTLSGADISIRLATNGSGTPTSTMAQVAAAINAAVGTLVYATATGVTTTVCGVLPQQRLFGGGIPFDSMFANPKNLTQYPKADVTEESKGVVVDGSTEFEANGNYTFTAADVGRSVRTSWSTQGNNTTALITAVLADNQVDTDHTFTADEIGLRWELLVGLGVTVAGSDLFTIKDGYQFTISDLGKAINIPGINTWDKEYIIIGVLAINQVRVHKRFVASQTQLAWILQAAESCVFGEGYAATLATLCSTDIPLVATGVASGGLTIDGTDNSDLTIGGALTVPGSIFQDTDVGRTLTISAATNPANNRAVTISALVGAAPTNQVQLSGTPFLAETNTFVWTLS